MALTLDLDQVRAFLTVAEAGTMTRAAARLGRSQSAVTLQVAKLERTLGGALFARSARGVRLTPAGERFVGQARRLMRLNEEILAGLTDSEIEGEVRLGAPEDFATLHLPAILAAFGRAYPRVGLQVTCDLTVKLVEAVRTGELDLALMKREPLGPDIGTRVWREPLVWVAADTEPLTQGGPLPLVVAPAPCVYRRRAIEALESHGLAWRTVYTSPSLAGQHAALRAGLGLTVLPREMVPRDLAILGPEHDLPRLADTEIALISAPGHPSRAAERLRQFILDALDRERSPQA